MGGIAKVLVEVLGTRGPGGGGWIKRLPEKHECSGSPICTKWASHRANYFHYVVGHGIGQLVIGCLRMHLFLNNSLGAHLNCFSFRYSHKCSEMASVDGGEQ